MPTYEMPILIRVMNKPETFKALKRAATAIFDNGGFIRKIDNLGTKQLPCKLSFRGQTYWQASHFIYRFDVPPSTIENIMDEYKRDVDILRSRIYKEENVKTVECTLHDEMLPPIYRKNVIQLMEIAERQKKRRQKFQFSQEMKYYPLPAKQVS